jgi:hypothetical protein
MSPKLQMPYRAIIFGDGHLVEGWVGDRLTTDKGEFIVQRLRGNLVDSEWCNDPKKVKPTRRLSSMRLLEVAKVRTHESGELLLNDKWYGKLRFLPGSERFLGLELTRSPVLRSRADDVEALAFFKISSDELRESEIDLVLDDWRSARSSKTPSFFDFLDSQFSILDLPLFDPLGKRKRFAVWSVPVWLRKFEQVESKDAERSSNPINTKGSSGLTKVGRLEYAPDFKLIRLGGQYFNLSSRPRARFCIQYMVEQRAFSEPAARSLRDEIDPYVREHTGLLKAVAVKMTDYFANERGLKLQELRRLLICAAGRNGRYFLKVT